MGKFLDPSQVFKQITASLQVKAMNNVVRSKQKDRYTFQARRDKIPEA
jgi:hypothetical protein